MPPAVAVATIEGPRQKHVDRADEHGITVRVQSPVTIAPANATLHHVEADICIQVEALKPFAEAAGGLLDCSLRSMCWCEPSAREQYPERE